MSQRGQGTKKKYFHRIFASPCFVHVESLNIVLLRLKVTDGSESEVCFDWVLLLLHRETGKDERQMEVAYVL